MALTLQTYADESGIHGKSPYCVVAGHVASPRQWKEFSKRWISVLRNYSVPDFHSKQFFTRDDRGRRLKPYRGWSDTRANTFLRELLAVIRSRRLYPVGGAVHMPAFNAVSYGERRFLTNGIIAATGKWKTSGAPSKPYHFALQLVLTESLAQAPDDAVVHFTFDQQNVLESGVRQTVEAFAEYGVLGKMRSKLGDVIYADRRKKIPLQLADLYTHCWYSYLVRDQGMSAERVTAMDELTRRRDGMRVLGAEEIEGLLSGLPKELRKQMQAEGPPQRR